MKCVFRAVVLSSVLFMSLDVQADSTLGIEPTPLPKVQAPESPLAKYKSQSELLKSGRSVKRVLKDFFLSDVSMFESVVLRELSRSESAQKFLSAIEEQRYFLANDNNQIGIFNTSELEEVMRLDYGACTGVTMLSWIFNHLVAYDISGEQSYQMEGLSIDELSRVRNLLLKTERTASENAEILNFYRPYIDRATLKLGVTFIPFFKNASEFTSHPALKRAFMWRAIELWYNYNTSVGGVVEMLPSTNPKMFRLEYDEVLKTTSRIQKYLDLKIQPIVFISAAGQSHHAKWLHVLQAIRVKKDALKGEIVIDVIDPNNNAHDRFQSIIFRGMTKDARYNPKKLRAIYTDPTNWGEERPLTEAEIVPWMSNLTTIYGMSILKALKKEPALQDSILK